ncbi:tigger transposable element-derived protein 7-like [Procambarus clarkii]|uniref:tigger transposable element-derived protein 7-like n=1 Tax=Procambarus clarkii TaxID=6728 RepID=UPI003743C47D
MSQSSIRGVQDLKRKRKYLSIDQKIDLIEKAERGYSVTRLAQEFNIGKATVCDIKKQKDNIRKFVAQSQTHAIGNRKTLKPAKYTDLDSAVFKWFTQHRAKGIAVSVDSIRNAAERLAEKLNIDNFKASTGWVCRFKERHGIINKKICGEALSADVGSINAFKYKLSQHMVSNNLSWFQVYNADETGFNWKCLQKNTLASRLEESIPGRKVSKERISALLCGNADGSHRTKCAIVGKSANPRALKNCMNRLPVVYYNTKNACFTQIIFEDWFQNHFCKEVRKHQINERGIRPADVKAMLLVANAPAHPIAKLTSPDGKITCMALPPNTTSLIQPMDQGVIYALKRLYKRAMNVEIMEVLLSQEDERLNKDTKASRTLENFKKYSIKDAIYIWAKQWNELKVTTLKNAWNKILSPVPGENKDEDDYDFEGFDNAIFETLGDAGEEDLQLSDVTEWLDNDAADPGYGELTDDEIIQCVTGNADEDAEEEEDTCSMLPIPYAASLQNLNQLLDMVAVTDDEDVADYYLHLRGLKDIIMKKLIMKKQTKIQKFLEMQWSQAEQQC